MKRFFSLLIIPFMCIIGCGVATSPVTPTKPVTDKPHQHDHADVGPSGGTLILWGEEEYHCELVIEVGPGAVTVNVLDGNLKKLVPIDAKTLSLTLQATPPVVLTLTPKPNEGDTAGKSSRFVVTNDSLKANKSWKGSLTGKVNGKNYVGDFEQKSAEKK